MKVKIGDLNKKVNVQQNVPIQDAYGEAVDSWNTIFSPWASISPLVGREFFSAQQVNSEISIKIIIRFDARVTSLNRITKGNKVYEILSVINDYDDNRFLVLMCKEVM